MKKLFAVPGSELFSELKRRKVYPVVAAYTVVAWLLLQIAEVTFQPLGLPDWAMSGLIILAIAGLPVALFLSWVFDITPTGLRRDTDLIDQKQVSDHSSTIAVLPFVDMSPDNDQGYFCDGVAEEILNTLTRIPNLSVAARLSSFKYRDGIGDVQEIGRQLGVKTILEGSVRKFGNQLRITAQLVEVSNGFDLWSKRFDEELEDIFAIQDEIATSIAYALFKTMRPVTTASTRNLRAYEFYLRGRYFFNRVTKTDIESARQMFHQAIDADPEFALAWAGLADCNSFLIMYVDPNEDYREKADSASRKALELDPELAEAHASRGLAFLASRDFEQADVEFKRAINLNPQLFEAHYYYARSRFHQGDMRMAIELFGRASDLNPDDYQSRLLRIQILRGMGREKEAAEEAKAAIPIVERHLEWNPDDVRALQLGAGSLILLGQSERAEDWLHRAMEIDSDDSVLLYNVACNYATLGKYDEALDYLEKALKCGTVSVAWMRNDEDLVGVRSHPRYKKLLRSMDQQG